MIAQTPATPASPATTVMEELVYPQLLREAARRCSHATAISDDNLDLCICTLAERALRVADGLATHVPGSRPFAVLARNRVDYATLWQVALTGARVITPLNWRLAPPELEHVLRDSEADVLFVEDDFWDVAQELQRRIPRVVLIPFEPRQGAELSLQALVETGHARSVPVPREGDVVTIMYTGGTTGAPKGVVLNQRGLMLGLYRQAFAYDTFTARDRWLLTTPMFHASSFAGLHGVPVSGGSVLVQQNFHPAAFISDVEQHGITGCVMVPTMLQMVLDHPTYRPERLRTLRLIGYGGSPIPEELLERLLLDLPDCDLRQIYGSTEIGGIATLLGADEHRRGGEALRSAGTAMPGVRLSIQEPDGQELPPGSIGEICIHTGSMMVGYHQAPEQTAAALHDGWYRSGDAGYLDAEGRLFVVDRLKDMIVTGGENVYSAEVENALASHPAIVQVAVIGVPHRVWGEAVHAVVVLSEGADLGADEVIAHARSRLAGYKTPKSVEFRAALPVSAANKVLKHELRSQCRGTDAGHDPSTNTKSPEGSSR